MPRFICLQCITQINQANIFKKQCIESDQFLKNKIVEFKQQQLVEITVFIEDTKKNALQENDTNEDLTCISETTGKHILKKYCIYTYIFRNTIFCVALVMKIYIFVLICMQR